MTEAIGGTTARALGLRWPKFLPKPIVTILVLLLLVLMVPPVVYLVQVSLHTSRIDGSLGDFTTRHYSGIFYNPRFLNNLLNTCIFAGGSAVVAIVLGAIQAWIVERTDTPFRQFTFLTAILSLSMPQVLYTIGWLLLLGKSGPLNDLLRIYTGEQDAAFNVYSMTGMILVEGLTWSPLSFLLLSSVFRSVDASFEEAAMMSGSSIIQTLRRVTLPLATPALLALLLLIVIRCFEAFEIPALVGSPGRVRVITTDIYDAVHKTIPANYGQAGAFSVMLFVIVVFLLQLYHRLNRHAERYQTITGKGFRPRVMRLGRLRYFTAGVLILFFAMLIVLPIGIILLASLQGFYERVSLAAFTNMTLENYRHVFKSESFRDSIGNTLILGSATATAVCCLTAILAWLVVRRQRGAWLLDQLAMVPLVFPALVLGLAFMQIYLNLPFAFYGTLASVIFASMVRYLPYGMRYSYAGVLQIHKEIEEAASVAGANAFTVFRRIVLPLIGPALLTCWLFVFLLSVRAVSMAILLVGPNSQIIAVSLFDLWVNGQTAELAAMGFTWMLLMTAVSTVFYLAARRFGLAVH